MYDAYISTGTEEHVASFQSSLGVTHRNFGNVQAPTFVGPTNSNVAVGPSGFQFRQMYVASTSSSASADSFSQSFSVVDSTIFACNWSTLQIVSYPHGVKVNCPSIDPV